MGDVLLKVKKLYTPEEELDNKAILIRRGKIKDIIPWKKIPSGGDVIDFSEQTAVPGFIDIHTHGYKGLNFTSSNPRAFTDVSRELPKTGVTSFLPTTVSESHETLLEVCGAYREAKRIGDQGSEMLGLHLEGPHLGKGEEKGAQNPAFLREPNIDELEELMKMSEGSIKMVTLAPELSGSLKYIRRAKELGIVVSAGHTASTYEEANEGFNSGISIVNHLFNGMKNFHHRNPGIIGASLTRDDVFVELIIDMIHLHPATVDMAIRAKGTDKSILITDSISATGLPDGKYKLGGQEIVIEDGISRVKETGRLAGSTLTMDKAIKNVASELNVDLKETLKMASTNPAKALELKNYGKIKPGYIGNITLLDSDLVIMGTVISGEVAYSNLKS